MLLFDNIPIKYQYKLPWIKNSQKKKKDILIKFVLVSMG